ncbi:TetR/AcrR family transcriptional regulator [Nonomuraea typhae]|uniref:TetR/AcrR family transcriptional regulator n=1 Tax=Nonomuraea typhae TaxID=2603600 RepID=UPI0012FB67EA|nr:TetR family transcriptional regulator [Nonomuraea typhae]
MTFDHQVVDTVLGEEHRGRQATEAASRAEVAAVGVSGLTMDGIATRATAARSSLYRRWNSPEDLVLDALNHTIPQAITVPDHSELRADMLAVLTELGAVLAGPASQRFWCPLRLPRAWPPPQAMPEGR